MRRRLTRRILFIAALLLAVLIAGTIGFRLICGYPLFDAFYMTLITISTVGYQEVRPLTQAGRIFNSFVIFFGVTAMFFAVGAMTQTIIELELQNRFGERRKNRMIEHLKDHFVVCGFGRVGRNASCELQRAKVPLLVLDRNPQRVERASQMGMLARVADATRDDDLREAGVVRARGLIAALPGDAENLFIILSAKTLNPNLRVATRASEEEAGEKLRRAGADIVFAPYTLAGYRLAQAVMRPHVMQFLDLATKEVGLNLTMEQVRVEEGSELVAKRLADLARQELNVIVLALRTPDGRMVFNPPPSTEIAAGDFLIALGEQASLDRLEGLLAGERKAG
jgi:voltage-gated potassium channel